MRAALASLGLAALVLSPLSGTARQALPSADDLARRIQTHYDAVRDFACEFQQHYAGGFLPQETDDRGKLKVKKPGMMRWEYETGEKQVFVADGMRFYSYYPKGKHGTESPLPTGDNVSTAVLFLAGRGNLTRDFSPTMAATQPATEWWLTLKPKKTQSDFVSLTLIVERASLKMVGLIKTDAQQAVTTFRFSNLKENVGVSTTAFNFQFPPGTQIER